MGTAEQQAILQALEDAEQSRTNGELTFGSGDRRARVFFSKGRVAWVSLSEKGRTFTEYLETNTGMNRHQLAAVYDDCRETGKPIGETIVEWGLLRSSELRQYLLEHISLCLFEVFGWSPIEHEYEGTRRSYQEDFLYELREVIEASLKHDGSGVLSLEGYDRPDVEEDADLGASAAEDFGPEMTLQTRPSQELLDQMRQAVETGADEGVPMLDDESADAPTQVVASATLDDLALRSRAPQPPAVTEPSVAVAADPEPVAADPEPPSPTEPEPPSPTEPEPLPDSGFEPAGVVEPVTAVEELIANVEGELPPAPPPPEPAFDSDPPTEIGAAAEVAERVATTAEEESWFDEGAGASPPMEAAGPLLGSEAAAPTAPISAPNGEAAVARVRLARVPAKDAIISPPPEPEPIAADEVVEEVPPPAAAVVAEVRSAARPTGSSIPKRSAVTYAALAGFLGFLLGAGAVYLALGGSPVPPPPGPAPVTGDPPKAPPDATDTVPVDAPADADVPAADAPPDAPADGDPDEESDPDVADAAAGSDPDEADGADAPAEPEEPAAQAPVEGIVAGLEAGSTGTLRVVSRPRGARIFLDGVDTGESTPASLTGVAAGREHLVVLTRKGYRTQAQQLPVAEGETAKASFTLRKKGARWKGTAAINLVSEPDGAAIFVDGRKRAAKTPTELPLKLTGPSRVELRLAGHRKWVRTLHPAPDVEVTIHARLQSR